MRIYYIVDEKSRVFPCCDWNESIDPNPDWFAGDIPDNAYEEHGIPLYKRYNEAIVARTASEVQADIDALPVPEPTPQEMLRADVDFLLMLLEE